MSLSAWFWETLGAASTNVQIQLRFGNSQLSTLYYRQVLLKFISALPISVCLVMGGATVAGLKAGPRRYFH